MTVNLITAVASGLLLIALEWQSLKQAPALSRWLFGLSLAASGLLYYVLTEAVDIWRPVELLVLWFGDR